MKYNIIYPIFQIIPGLVFKEITKKPFSQNPLGSDQITSSRQCLSTNSRPLTSTG